MRLEKSESWGREGWNRRRGNYRGHKGERAPYHHKNLDFYSEEGEESFGGVCLELTLHFIMISLPPLLRKTMREGEGSRETDYKSTGMIKIRDVSAWTKRAAVEEGEKWLDPNVTVKKQPQDLLTDIENGCGQERVDDANVPGLSN